LVHPHGATPQPGTDVLARDLVNLRLESDRVIVVHLAAFHMAENRPQIVVLLQWTGHRRGWPGRLPACCSPTAETRFPGNDWLVPTSSLQPHACPSPTDPGPSKIHVPLSLSPADCTLESR